MENYPFGEILFFLVSLLLWIKKDISFLSDKMSAEKVAEIGINALFRKKLSVITGSKTNFLALANRLIPRKLAANISKKIMSAKR